MSADMTSIDATAFDRTVADLKHGVDTATAAQSAASEKAIATAKDFAAFSQGTVQAFTEASQLLAAGSQDLLRQVAATSRTAMTESMSSFRAIMGAGSFKEGLELQANFFRTSAIWSVSEASRFAHANIELAEKAAAPLMARAVLAADTIAYKG